MPYKLFSDRDLNHTSNRKPPPPAPSRSRLYIYPPTQPDITPENNSSSILSPPREWAVADGLSRRGSGGAFVAGGVFGGSLKSGLFRPLEPTSN
jgi:hypothetical protein